MSTVTEAGGPTGNQRLGSTLPEQTFVESRTVKPTTNPSKTAIVELGEGLDEGGIRMAAPASLLEMAVAEPQRAFPAIAKDSAACARIEEALRGLSTGHRLHNLDSRQLTLPLESVDLVVTSPPYWTLKKYNDHEDQLGDVEDYEDFLDQLDEVWRAAYDALVQQCLRWLSRSDPSGVEDVSRELVIELPEDAKRTVAFVTDVRGRPCIDVRRRAQVTVGLPALAKEQVDRGAPVPVVQVALTCR